MFSGIVQESAPIRVVDQKGALKTFAIKPSQDFIFGLKRGASISIDGACMTVTDIKNEEIHFDAMKESLDVTTLGDDIKARNLERSFHVGDEIGGHILSGHVTGTATIKNVHAKEGNYILTFQTLPEWMKYIFPKGFIAIDGMSLTIVDVNHQNATFTVHLIPETLRITTIASKNPGDKVNIELDANTKTIVDTIKSLITSNPELITQAYEKHRHPHGLISQKGGNQNA